jgi:hypothetical protein
MTTREFRQPRRGLWKLLIELFRKGSPPKPTESEASRARAQAPRDREKLFPMF